MDGRDNVLHPEDRGAFQMEACAEVFRAGRATSLHDPIPRGGGSPRFEGRSQDAYPESESEG